MKNPNEIRALPTNHLILAARNRMSQELKDAIQEYDKLGDKFFQSLPFTIVIKKDGSALFNYKKETYKVESPKELKSFVRRFVKNNLAADQSTRIASECDSFRPD